LQYIYFCYHLVLIAQRKISVLATPLRHQTSATKLRYLRSSAFYRVPHFIFHATSQSAS